MAVKSTSPKPPQTYTISTGIPGLDAVLCGGLIGNRLYLVEGRPGTGKTTLALQFLLDGIKKGERVLYVTLSETSDELREVARSHGWALDDETLFELIPPEASIDRDSEQSILHPSEVELGETTQVIFDKVMALKPKRVVFDSMSEMRLLARNSLFYRRQILALKHFFARQDCTVLLLDDLTSAMHDLQLHSIAHGVIVLEQPPREYGVERRRLRVAKLRGVNFRGGYHDFVIQTGGLAIFPRLVASDHNERIAKSVVSSGIRELDLLLGGGLNRGTSTLLVGPAGCGKTTLAAQYVMSVAEKGGRAALFCFDEATETLLARMDGLGMTLRRHLEGGRVAIKHVNPAELAPGEFAFQIRDAVERLGTEIVVIDSLNGYMNAMPEEKFLVMQMHELLSYLNNKGVLTILVMAQHGFLQNVESPVDLSYLSDNVLMLRFFEADGELRQALSVLKKRAGNHERAIREFRMTQQGLKIGPPLMEFHGVLSGIPEYRGNAQPLLKAEGHGAGPG
jgi:circadian clock protein KaiC